MWEQEYNTTDWMESSAFLLACGCGDCNTISQRGARCVYRLGEVYDCGGFSSSVLDPRAQCGKQNIYQIVSIKSDSSCYTTNSTVISVWPGAQRIDLLLFSSLETAVCICGTDANTEVLNNPKNSLKQKRKLQRREIIISGFFPTRDTEGFINGLC